MEVSQTNISFSKAITVITTLQVDVVLYLIQLS